MRSNKRMRKTKKQRLWKQKGCSNLANKSRKGKTLKNGGGCGCGLPFMGGVKHKSKKMCIKMGGGSANLPPLPPALVGAPWTPNISNWPGVAGQDGVTNYYPMNQYHVDPQTQVMQERAGPLFTGTYTGGRTRKHRTKKVRGGGLIPQDLLNIGRTFTYGLGSAYNAVNGYTQPVSPLPYMDQLRSSVKI